uniref:Uncharacterized protein n=1 Tax=Panagrolaimus davidi TaxID=227884 RepID=A0A914QLG4_9BILA
MFSKSKCSNMIICEPAGLYEIDSPEDQAFGADKECEACFDFLCTNDGGNTVYDGIGCYEDFIYACPSVPNEIKEKIRKNIEDSFYFDDNFIVTSCSNEETISNCDYKYISSNYWIKENFLANLNQSYMEYCPAYLYQPPQINITNM